MILTIAENVNTEHFPHATEGIILNQGYNSKGIAGRTMTLTPELRAQIDAAIAQNKIFVFMKGDKMMPQCGFSNNVVQILNTLGVEYETFNVLENDAVRQGIKEYSSWPTIPQVYINGEFIGGSDVIADMYQKGELQEMLAVAQAS